MDDRLNTLIEEEKARVATLNLALKAAKRRLKKLEAAAELAK